MRLHQYDCNTCDAIVVVLASTTRCSGLHYRLACVAEKRVERTITKKLFRRRNQRVDLMQSRAFAHENVSRVWPYIVRSHRRWTRCGWKCSATYTRTRTHTLFSISLKNCECITCAHILCQIHIHNVCILCINVRYFWETANNSTLFKWETFFVLLLFSSLRLRLLQVNKMAFISQNIARTEMIL